jgi:hypothetical protein
MKRLGIGAAGVLASAVLATLTPRGGESGGTCVSAAPSWYNHLVPCSATPPGDPDPRAHGETILVDGRLRVGCLPSHGPAYDGYPMRPAPSRYLLSLW